MLTYFKKILGVEPNDPLLQQFSLYNDEQKKFVRYFYNTFDSRENQELLIDNYSASSFKIEACHIHALPDHAIDKDIPASLAVFLYILKNSVDMSLVWETLFSENYQQILLKEGGEYVLTAFLESINFRLFNLGITCEPFGNIPAINFFAHTILCTEKLHNLQNLYEGYSHWHQAIANEGVLPPGILKAVSSNYNIICLLHAQIKKGYEAQIAQGALLSAFDDADVSVMSSLSSLKKYVHHLENDSIVLSHLHRDNIKMIEKLLTIKLTIEDDFWLGKLVKHHYPELLAAYNKLTCPKSREAQEILTDALMKIENKLQVLVDNYHMERDEEALRQLKIGNRFFDQ